MTKQVIRTDSAPAAVGPYSQGVRSGELLFLSGQIPLNREGQLVARGIEAQTRQVMENLAAILAAAGARLDDVVKTTIYLTDLADFAAMNEVYGSYFESEPPARATVQVVGLPKGVCVEIEAIARLG
jgi:2-iminobutanoate/2-iminopropanoate deaminase